MRLALSVLLLMLSLASAHAQGLATFYYQKDRLTIMRSQPPALPPLPWQEPGTAAYEPATVHFNATIRPMTGLRHQDGWVDLGDVPIDEAALFVLESPGVIALYPMELHQPLDIIWVDETGSITAIAPELKLSSLGETIVEQTPSKALLFLAGGTCERMSIRPGDRVRQADFFTPPPAIHSLIKPSPPPSK